jgi:hypothetical protein
MRTEWTATFEKHGVTAVYVEGVTEQDLPVYEARLKKVHSLGEKLQLLRKIAVKIDDKDLADKLKAGDVSLRSECFVSALLVSCTRKACSRHSRPKTRPPSRRRVPLDPMGKSSSTPS